MKIKHITGTNKDFELEVNNFLATLDKSKEISIKYSTTTVNLMEEYGIAVEYSALIVYEDE